MKLNKKMNITLTNEEAETLVNASFILEEIFSTLEENDVFDFSLYDEESGLSFSSDKLAITQTTLTDMTINWNEDTKMVFKVKE